MIHHRYMLPCGTKISEDAKRTDESALYICSFSSVDHIGLNRESEARPKYFPSNAP